MIIVKASKPNEKKWVTLVLAGIEAANMSRIEQGRYSVGVDILSKKSHALGLKVDIV